MIRNFLKLKKLQSTDAALNEEIGAEKVLAKEIMSTQ